VPIAGANLGPKTGAAYPAVFPAPKTPTILTIFSPVSNLGSSEHPGAPLTPAEQAKLEASLHLARQALSNTVGVAAWLEGWTLPVEKVIEEVLMPDAASPSC